MIERRAQFELMKATKRLHLVSGFLAAMQDLDEVVGVIRSAADAAEAGETLQSGFGLSKEQAEGVLGLTLRRLTSLEVGKLRDEQKTLQSRYGWHAGHSTWFCVPFMHRRASRVSASSPISSRLQDC